MYHIHSYEKPSNFLMSESLIVFNQFINLPNMTLVSCCHQSPLCTWFHSSSWLTILTLFGANDIEYPQKSNLLLKAQEWVLTAGFCFQTIATQAPWLPIKWSDGAMLKNRWQIFCHISTAICGQLITLDAFVIQPLHV